MGDMIDRDALEAKIRENSMRIRFFDPSVNVILHLIRYAPAVNRWISVEDALPEIGQNVLIYAVGKEKCYESKITITKRTDVIWFGHEIKTEPYWKDPWQYFHSDYEITHWMPLPEPPEKE